MQLFYLLIGYNQDKQVFFLFLFSKKLLCPLLSFNSPHHRISRTRVWPPKIPHSIPFALPALKTIQYNPCYFNIPTPSFKKFLLYHFHLASKHISFMKVILKSNKKSKFFSFLILPSSFIPRVGKFNNLISSPFHKTSQCQYFIHLTFTKAMLVITY